MRSQRFFTFLVLCLFCIAVGLAGAGIGRAQTAGSSSLSLNDQRAIQSSLQKAGINLTPEEIRKGKEAFEKQEGVRTGKMYKMPNAPEEQQMQRPEGYLDSRTAVSAQRSIGIQPDKKDRRISGCVNRSEAFRLRFFSRYGSQGVNGTPGYSGSSGLYDRAGR